MAKGRGKGKSQGKGQPKGRGKGKGRPLKGGRGHIREIDADYDENEYAQWDEEDVHQDADWDYNPDDPWEEDAPLEGDQDPQQA